MPQVGVVVMGAPSVLAHPLTEADALPLAPVAVAAIAVVVVLLTATRPVKGSLHVPPDTRAPRPVGWAQAIAVAVLAVVIVAGRTGASRVTQNIAPALVVGAGWPLVVALTAVVGPLWQRLNPWDGLARVFIPLTHDERHPGDAADVRPALVTAGALVWYLFAYPGGLLPRSVGAAVGLYSLVTVAGCLALGRATWLSRFEIVTIFLSWVGKIRRRRLVAWYVPRGAAPVMGVLTGGFLFGLVRYSRMLNPLVFDQQVLPPETAGLLIASGLAVVLLVLTRRWEERGESSGTAVAATVPVAAGLALAASLVRGQALIAAQLLPALASDPLGRGWNLFGTAGWQPHPNPLGDTWHVVLQVGLIAAGGIAGAQVARRRAATTERGRLWPALTTVTVLVTAGVLAVTAL